MGVSRRRFLKIAGISTLGAAAKPAGDAFAIQSLDELLGGFTIPETLLHMFHRPAGETPGEALTAKRWAMVVNVNNCPEDCKACTEVCHKVHNVPSIENPKHEIKWIWQEPYENTFPDQQHELIADRVKKTPFMVLCNHCYNPACVRVCPTKATFKRSDGIVLMDMHRCIGCRFCMAACPFGARSFNWLDPRKFLKEEDQNPEFPTRMKGVVEKCNFCAERLAKGLIPACVEACEKATKKARKKPALVFGDLEDPSSEVRELLSARYTIRRKPALGTQPNVYYIV